MIRLLVQIAIVSGKGGTGKTSFTAGLAPLFRDAIFVDCDVDAPNLGIILGHKVIERYDFVGNPRAKIDEVVCTACGKCLSACRFDAIKKKDSKYYIDEIDCEGCFTCGLVCPVDAISQESSKSGEWYISQTKYGLLIHAQLGIGEENSGKLVSILRNEAQKYKSDWVIIDGPPGIGCPLISSLTGVDYAIIVTEPTYSAIHDMERVIQVAQHFNIPVAIVINKYDLNPENTKKVEDFAQKTHIPVLGKIPLDDTVYEAIRDCRPVTEFDSPAGKEIRQIAERIKR